MLNGSVSGFTEALAAKNFGGFRLRVLSQSNEKLDTALVKKQGLSLSSMEHL